MEYIKEKLRDKEERIEFLFYLRNRKKEKGNKERSLEKIMYMIFQN